MLTLPKQSKLADTFSNFASRQDPIWLPINQELPGLVCHILLRSNCLNCDSRVKWQLWEVGSIRLLRSWIPWKRKTECVTFFSRVEGDRLTATDHRTLHIFPAEWKQQGAPALLSSEPLSAACLPASLPAWINMCHRKTLPTLQRGLTTTSTY